MLPLAAEWRTIMKTTLSIQHAGKETSDKDMVAKVKESWVATGEKIKNIKTLDIYIKPEENTVYYVINGDTSGSFPL